jgi:hypothetical protein
MTITTKVSPNPENLTATIRVRLVVEVTVGNWDASNTFMNLREQATREAKQQLESVIQKACSSVRIISQKSMHVALVGEVE